MHGNLAGGPFGKASNSLAECYGDAVTTQNVLHRAGLLDIERRQDLIPQFQQSDVEALVDQIFNHLQANEPAADHDGALAS